MTWKYPNDSIEKPCKLMVFVNLIMHQRCHIFQYDYSQMKLIFILKTITEWRVWHVIGDISYELKKKTLFTLIEEKMKKKPLGQGIGFIGYSEAGLTAWTCVVIYNILYLTTFNSTIFVYSITPLTQLSSHQNASLTSWYWLQFTEINYHPSITTCHLHLGYL